MAIAYLTSVSTRDELAIVHHVDHETFEERVRFSRRQLLDVGQLALNGPRPPARFVDLRRGPMQILLDAIEHDAELGELCLDRAEQRPHLGRSLLNCERSE